MLQIWESMMVFSCPNFWTVLKKVYDSMCSIFGVDTHYHSKPLGIGCGSSSNPWGCIDCSLKKSFPCSMVFMQVLQKNIEKPSQEKPALDEKWHIPIIPLDLKQIGWFPPFQPTIMIIWFLVNHWVFSGFMFNRKPVSFKWVQSLVSSRCTSSLTTLEIVMGPIFQYHPFLEVSWHGVPPYHPFF